MCLLSPDHRRCSNNVKKIGDSLASDLFATFPRTTIHVICDLELNKQTNKRQNGNLPFGCKQDKVFRKNVHEPTPLDQHLKFNEIITFFMFPHNENESGVFFYW